MLFGGPVRKGTFSSKQLAVDITFVRSAAQCIFPEPVKPSPTSLRRYDVVRDTTVVYGHIHKTVTMVSIKSAGGEAERAKHIVKDLWVWTSRKQKRDKTMEDFENKF